MEDGVLDVRSKMVDVRCKMGVMVDVKCQMLDVRCCLMLVGMRSFAFTNK